MRKQVFGDAGDVMKETKRNHAGFTLAELLIVVAIIGVLIAVAVPMFGAQRERANIAVDQSTMRNAYAYFIAEALTDNVEDGKDYFYDLASQSIVPAVTRPAGYGRAKTDASHWWSGVGTASGSPNNGTAAPLLLTMDENGSVTFRWASGTYVGAKITNQTDYTTVKDSSATFKEKGNLFYTDLVARDKLLLDSLQATVQGMTYRELYDLFYDRETNKLKSEFNKSSITGESEQKLVQSGTGGNLCFTLAESTISGNMVEVDDAANKHNGVLSDDVSKLFTVAGYDVSSDAEENYLITSISGKTNARIWLNIGVKDLKKLKDSEETASNAYTYIKGATAPTASVLREEDRRIG